MTGNFRYTGINLVGWIQEIIMNEKIHFLCLLKQCLKDNNKTAHWVGHSQLKSLDTDDFSKRTPFVDDIQASLTGNTIEQ